MYAITSGSPETGGVLLKADSLVLPETNMPVQILVEKNLISMTSNLSILYELSFDIISKT